MICNDDNSTEDSRNPSEVPCQRSDSNRIEITLPDGQTHTVNLDREPTDWIPALVKEFGEACRKSNEWYRKDLTMLTSGCRTRGAVCYSSSMRAIDTFAVSCKRWQCHDCAPYMAKRLLRHFLGMIVELYADGRSVWLVEVAVRDYAMVREARIRVRQRAHKRDASFLTVCRGPILAILATTSLEGVKSPTAMRELDLPEAIDALVRLFQVPFPRPEQSPWDKEARFRPFTQSADWTPPPIRGGRGDWTRIVMASRAHIPQQVADDMGYSLGDTIRPKDGMSAQGFVEEFKSRVDQKNEEVYRESHPPESENE